MDARVPRVRARVPTRAKGGIRPRSLCDRALPLPNKSSTDANGSWYVTLQNINDPVSATTPPNNFYTIQIDPVSGAMKQFRPGI